MTDRPPWAGSTRARRLPPGWEATRQRIFARDGGICYMCGKPGADQVDHIKRGDDHSDENLGSAHRACHLRKSQKEASAARWKIRERRDPERHPGLLTDEEMAARRKATRGGAPFPVGDPDRQGR